MYWLDTRRPPRNREYATELYKQAGLAEDDLTGFLTVTKGLSVEDAYWTPGIHDATRFGDVNLFDHNMSGILSLVAYTGRSEYQSGKVTGLSSEWSTGGTFPKAWRRVEGKLKLYKSYAFQEQVNTVYAEFYASQILDTLGYSHVPYTLHKWKGKMAAVSELFTSKEVAYVPYAEVHRETHPYAVLSAMLKAGEPLQVVEQARRMYISDVLMQNLDRHTNNFGYLRDSCTGRLVDFAPLFDHNLALYTATLDKPTKATTGEDLLNRMSVKNFPMRSRVLVQALLTPDDHRALRRVLNLHLEPSSSYPGSSEYRRMVDTATRKMAAAMLRVPANSPSDVYKCLLDY